MKTIVPLIISFFLTSIIYAQSRATFNQDYVEISWLNPTQQSIDYFVIERSKTGENFKEVLKIDGYKGNKKLTAYYNIVYQHLSKPGYYRIKQVSADGTVCYSNMLMTQNYDSVKPWLSSRSNSIMEKELRSYEAREILVVLVDKNNDKFVAKVDVVESNKHLVATYVNINLPSGDYIVVATSDDKVYGNQLKIDDNCTNSVYTQNK